MYGIGETTCYFIRREKKKIKRKEKNTILEKKGRILWMKRLAIFPIRWNIMYVYRINSRAWLDNAVYYTRSRHFSRTIHPLPIMYVHHIERLTFFRLRARKVIFLGFLSLFFKVTFRVGLLLAIYTSYPWRKRVSFKWPRLFLPLNWEIEFTFSIPEKKYRIFSFITPCCLQIRNAAFCRPAEMGRFFRNVPRYASINYDGLFYSYIITNRT